MHDLMNTLSFVSALTPGIQIKASVAGNDIDPTALNDGNDGIVFVVTAGAITYGTHTFSLQDSLDGGVTWNTVVAPYFQTPVNQNNAFTSVTPVGTTIKMGYLGNPNVGNLGNSASALTGGKWQVRLYDTVTGAPVTGGYYSAVAVLGYPFSAPSA